MYKGSLMLLLMQETHVYIQNVYMLTITQTNSFLISVNHVVSSDSAFVVKVFTGGSSSVMQSRGRHYVIYAHIHIDLE